MAKKPSTKKTAKPKITAKQEGGDDGYQYVIRVNGKVAYSGLSRREVASYKADILRRWEQEQARKEALEAIGLPSLVVEGKKVELQFSDLRSPDWNKKESLNTEELRKLYGAREEEYPSSQLSFYYTKDFGWVLLTLHISNPSRSQRGRGINTERSYGWRLDKKSLVTVGRGPHVLAEITVHIKKDNVARLAPFVAEWSKGAEEAYSYRDRLSSRRANSRSRGGLPSWF